MHEDSHPDKSYSKVYAILQSHDIYRYLCLVLTEHTVKDLLLLFVEGKSCRNTLRQSKCMSEPNASDEIVIPIPQRSEPIHYLLSWLWGIR